MEKTKDARERGYTIFTRRDDWLPEMSPAETRSSGVGRREQLGDPEGVGVVGVEMGEAVGLGEVLLAPGALEAPFVGARALGRGGRSGIGEGLEGRFKEGGFRSITRQRVCQRL